MREVTDPALLAQLNAPDSAPSGMREVTDPALLAQLNGTEQPDLLQRSASAIRNVESTVGNYIAPVVSPALRALKPYADSQFGSPQDLLGRLDQGVTKGFNAAGQFGAEQLAKEGMNPYVAGAVGGIVQAAPDLARSAAPEDELNLAVGAEDGANSFARRALGFTKRQLNTPLARSQASNAADVALREKVIPWLGNPETMQENALALKDQAGKALGEMRSAVGPVELQPFVDHLNAMKADVLKGRTGGVWDQIGSKIDNAIDTVKGLAGPDGKATLNDVADAKKALSDTVNWLSDLSSQKITKRVTGSLSQKIEDTVGEAGGDIARYRDENQTYGASKKMLEGIDNKLSSAEGNNLFSPLSTIGGIAELGSGHVPGAAAALGSMEILKRRGSSTIARMLNLLDQQGNTRIGLTPLMQMIASYGLRKRGQ